MATSSALFLALLGEQWHGLAAPVSDIHGEATRVRAVSAADMAGAGHLPAWLLRRLPGLPEPGPAQVLDVLIERHPDHETWTRHSPTAGCARASAAAGAATGCTNDSVALRTPPRR